MLHSLHFSQALIASSYVSPFGSTLAFTTSPRDLLPLLPTSQLFHSRSCFTVNESEAWSKFLCDLTAIYMLASSPRSCWRTHGPVMFRLGVFTVIRLDAWKRRWAIFATQGNSCGNRHGLRRWRLKPATETCNGTGSSPLSSTWKRMLLQKQLQYLQVMLSSKSVHVSNASFENSARNYQRRHGERS